jgi:hypothetical protein
MISVPNLILGNQEPYPLSTRWRGERVGVRGVAIPQPYPFLGRQGRKYGLL